MASKPLSKLQAAMKAKLQGGQFRAINEKLYTQPSKESFKMMQDEPELFEAYHAGFRAQVEGWPQNPLDIMIAECKKDSRAVVADFGCGEARLAASIPNRSHSFDLVAPPGNKYITAADMTHVPLSSSSVDIAVFCLSLMSTDYIGGLSEARRVLRAGGRLLIAEVKSRFENDEEDKPTYAQPQHAGVKRKREDNSSSSSGGGSGKPSSSAASAALRAFVQAVKQLGFKLELLNDSNRMFVLMFFRKEGHVTQQAGERADDSAPSSAVTGGAGGAATGDDDDDEDDKEEEEGGEGGASGSQRQAGGEPHKKKKKRRNKNKYRPQGSDGSSGSRSAAEPAPVAVPDAVPAKTQQKTTAAPAAAQVVVPVKPVAAPQNRPAPPPQQQQQHKHSQHKHKHGRPQVQEKEEGDRAAPAPDVAAPALKACVYKRR